jgi:hypothetical protein
VARVVPEHRDSLQTPVMRRLSHCRMTERFVWHRSVKYAGTLDAVAQLGTL